MTEEIIEKTNLPEVPIGSEGEKFKFPGFSPNDIGKFLKPGKAEDSEIRSKVTIVEKSDRTFEDIGGNKEAKKALRELATIIKGSKIHAAVGAEAERGYLLWGPSGNGKTELARALAGETGAIVIIVNYQDLASRWVNETPENIKALFQLAREIAAKEGRPVIIFFDEADALFMDRDGNGGTTHSMQTSALASLLTEMDGAHADNEDIYVIGATNRPDGMDLAARRRFGRKIEVPNPNEEDRIEILNIHRDRVRQSSRESGYSAPIFADSLSEETSDKEKEEFQEGYWREVAKATEGFSGDQLARLVKRATRLVAQKLQAFLEEADIEDLDEYLALHPEGLTLATVTATELIEIAGQMRREEEGAESRGSGERRPYSGTSKGYFGHE